MELDKSLAILEAFEKLYCLERNINEAPKNKHPFLNAVTGKPEDRKKSLKDDTIYVNKKKNTAETRPEKTDSQIYRESKIPFFRLILKKMESEFPTPPEVKEWREV